MKKLLICLVTMVCLLGVVGVAYGNSGSATIPSFWTGANGQLHILISNITEHPINIKVIFYDHNGEILHVPFTQFNFFNFNSNLTDASASFDLGANSSGELKFNTSSSVVGYGIIKWEQDSKAVNGLIAHGFQLHQTVNGYWTLPINDGLPF